MTTKGFTQVPNQLIIDERLSKEAKALFIYLRYLSPKYRNLRNSTLLTKLDICLSTLQKAKNELIKEGYLVIHRKASSNYYELRLSKKYSMDRVLNKQETKYNLLSIKSNNTMYNNNMYNNTSTKGFKGFKKFKK
jgi:DNA-binding transcriptional MocR family regulator